MNMNINIHMNMSTCRHAWQRAASKRRQASILRTLAAARRDAVLLYADCAAVAGVRVPPPPLRHHRQPQLPHAVAAPNGRSACRIPPDAASRAPATTADTVPPRATSTLSASTFTK